LNSSASRHRLFIALWPPQPVLQQLAEIAAALHIACGGYKITQQNQHITVVFLGGVMPGCVAHVQRALHASTGQQFELELDVIEHRRRGGLIWARATRVPDALDGLVNDLRSTLRGHGFNAEDRRFVPHVTLLRDARKPYSMPEYAPARWHADEITLVRSHLERRGARYEIVCRVPLAAHGSA
jgi:RNA 2',3'-cyclic 3'-phosphodiesterase